MRARPVLRRLAPTVRAPQTPGWRFSNRGIDGQTTERAARAGRDQVGALKPKIIVLQCGVNDLTAIGVLPEQRAQIVSNCKENLHKMIAMARAAGATVIIVTIIHNGRVTLDHRPFWSNQIAGAIGEVNEDLRRIHQPNVIVLDADEVFLPKSGKVRQEYYVDTLP